MNQDDKGSKDDSAKLLKKITVQKAKLAKIRNKETFVKTQVDPEIVSEVIADWTGIPVGKVQNDDAGKVINMAKNLETRIKGQTRAIEEIVRIVKSSKTGLKNPDQPNGVFLLVGPSGVGKTETGLAIADLLFGGEDSSISVNMSEFQEKHTVSRLIGSPPGYVGYGEGGVLTEAIRQRPYSAVLLDEAEKANSEVMNLFYQVFDKDVLANGEGRNINFKNTIMLLTSNLASDVITQMAQDESITTQQIVKTIKPILSEHFKPALLARMTIIPFCFLKATESMFSCFNIEITIVSELKLNSVDYVGKDGQVSVLNDDQDQYFHGLISTFTFVNEMGRFYLYKATIMPHLQQLAYTSDVRVFQNKTTKEIIKQILEEHQILSNSYTFRDHAEYTPREYCVQYRETNLEFISRLLSEEGLFYYFTFTKTECKIIFGDTFACHGDIPDNKNIKFSASGELTEQGEQEHITNFDISEQK